MTSAEFVEVFYSGRYERKFKEISFDNPQLHLFSLSWPIFIDLAMHFITILINTWMVSMISIRAVAELNVGGQVFQLGFTLFNFVNVGVCVCCAQALETVTEIWYEESFICLLALILSGALPYFSVLSLVHHLYVMS